MDQAGIDASILVPPSWEGDRNDYCLTAARDYPDRFAVMGRFSADDPSRVGELAVWKQQPGMLGIRLTFHNEVQKHWLDDGTVDWFWEEAESNGIPLMVFAPSLLPKVKEVALRHPRLRIVIDHLGVIGGSSQAVLPRLEPVLDLADVLNIAVKASCMPSLVNESYPFSSLHPAIKLIVECFGRERVFWGSDVSRLPCSQEENVRLFTEACRFLSDQDLEWIMGRGVREWLGWTR